jgi:hypothetical protein
MINLLVVVVASLAYALFDYFGFNWTVRQTKDNRVGVGAYHVFADIILAVMLYGIWQWFGLTAAIASFIVYWTFNYELLYYMWAELIHYNGFEGKGSFKNAVLENRVTWAWWTPLGIFHYDAKKVPIESKDLLIQAIVGWIAAILLLWMF